MYTNLCKWLVYVCTQLVVKKPEFSHKLDLLSVPITNSFKVFNKIRRQLQQFTVGLAISYFS